MNRNTLLWQTDSYKTSHFLQFPPNTQNNFYYFESRGGADFIKFFGLQCILKKNLITMPKEQEVLMAENFTLHTANHLT